jgi:hypothetical protein
MLVASLPFLGAFVLLLASRRTTTITTRAVRATRFFRTRTVPLDAVTHLVVPHASAAALAATADSRLAAALLVWDTAGKWFAVPHTVPIDVLRRVVAQALPSALERAEQSLSGGSRYMDPDAFSGLDDTNLYGTSIGVVSNKSCSAPLASVVRVTAEGRVETRNGEPFLVGAQDLVLAALLRRRGIEVLTPWSAARLTMDTDEGGVAVA